MLEQAGSIDKENLTLLGFALVLIYVMIKDVVGPLLDKRTSNGNGRSVVAMIKDLWHWHAPDHDGEQGWKGKPVERLLKQQNDLITMLSEEIKRNNRVLEGCILRRDAARRAKKDTDDAGE